MTNSICLDENYSTTRLLKKENFSIKNRPEEKFETILFLPENGNRKAEGGLRTKGYFKESYENKPLISIITVVFNGEKYLEQTIKSVINQNYDNVEYIIIDGGSTDNTLDIIKNYEDKVDYWVSEKDSGISDAFNKGISCCMGKLIGIINADDYYEVEAFLNIVDKYLEYSDLDGNIFYGNTYKITAEGQKKVKKNNTISWCMSVPFSHCSSMATRTYYKRNGLFSPKFKIAMDVDMLMRGFNETGYIKIDSFVATQRDGGISDTNRIAGYKEYMEASKEHCCFFKSYLYYILKILIIYKNKVLR